jgi:anti-anti-sigma factor
MDSLIDINVEEKNGILVVAVSGRLDATSSPVLDKRVADLTDSGRIKLVMNFDGLEYLSSAGMRILLSTTKKLKSNNGKFVVCEIGENVLEVIKMAGFDHILNLENDEEAALRSFD